MCPLGVGKVKSANWMSGSGEIGTRLWQQQGKRTEAYDLLAPIYGWLTEGLDTADLQEAKALLETLGA